MSNPIWNNNPIFQEIQSQQLALLLQQMQTQTTQNSNPQAIALAADILRLMNSTAQIEYNLLQQRFTLLQALLPQPADSAKSADGSTISRNWVHVLLQFFIGQLHSAVNDSLMQMLQNQQPQQSLQPGKSHIAKPDGKPNQAQSEEPLAHTSRNQDKALPIAGPKENPLIPQKDPAAYAPSSPHTSASKSERQVLAEMAVKLLSVNQLGKILVAPGSKEIGQQAQATAPHMQMIAQIGKMLGQIEELKVIIQNQNTPHLQAYLMLAADRVKETAAALEIFIQNPAMMGKVAEERIHQDQLLLSTLIAGTKQSSESAQKLSNPTIQPNSAGIAPQKNETALMTKAIPSGPTSIPINGPVTVPNPVQTPITPPPASAAPGQAKPGMPAPLPLHMPTTSADLIALIQAQLSKGIMQPVPIIVPFPVTFTMEEAINTTSSSSVGKEKTKNEEKGKRGAGGGGSEFSMLTMLLPPGPVIFGDHLDEGRADEKPVHIEHLDAYLMAATPVTNAQYAAFLTDALSNNTVRIEMPGKIYDEKGDLLCITIDGAPLSQLEIGSEGGKVIIRSLQGRENHPVVHVTYDGALAYCIANGFRLPSEYEWERAAGMLPTEYGQPLKKLRYGNGSDAISASSAVYKEGGFEKVAMNMTMPVAFFDGQKVYTKAGKRVETKHATSPWGCYDMSGNAREWTATCFDDEGFLMITKGGSYADTAFDLRVAAKTPLPRHTSDPYTTFRVAL